MAATGHNSGPAWRSRRAWVLLLTTITLALVADLATKVIAFERIAPVPVRVDREAVLAVDHPGRLIPPHEPVVVLPYVLEFTLVLNRGAVFGIGAGKRWFFIGFTIVAVGFVLWLFGRATRAGDWASHVAAGLLIGGGVGNLYDRIRFACVRDFIHPLPGVRVAGREVWPYVSNVADLFVLIGIAVLLAKSWRGHHDGGQPPADATTRPASEHP